MIYLIYKYLLYKLSEQLSELNKNNIRYIIYIIVWLLEPILDLDKIYNRFRYTYVHKEI